MSLKRDVYQTCVKRALYFSDANEDVRIVTDSLSGRRNSGGFFSICEHYQATQTTTLLPKFLKRYTASTLCEDFAVCNLGPFLLRVFPLYWTKQRTTPRRAVALKQSWIEKIEALSTTTDCHCGRVERTRNPRCLMEWMGPLLNCLLVSWWKNQCSAWCKM